jgi:hypothetical protein
MAEAERPRIAVLVSQESQRDRQRCGMSEGREFIVTKDIV